MITNTRNRYLTSIFYQISTSIFGPPKRGIFRKSSLFQLSKIFNMIENDHVINSPMKTLCSNGKIKGSSIESINTLVTCFQRNNSISLHNELLSPVSNNIQSTSNLSLNINTTTSDLVIQKRKRPQICYDGFLGPITRKKRKKITLQSTTITKSTKIPSQPSPIQINIEVDSNQDCDNANPIAPTDNNVNIVGNTAAQSNDVEENENNHDQNEGPGIENETLEPEAAIVDPQLQKANAIATESSKGSKTNAQQQLEELQQRLEKAEHTKKRELESLQQYNQELEDLHLKMQQASQTTLVEEKKARNVLQKEVENLKMQLEKATALEADNSAKKVQDSLQQLQQRLEDANNAKMRDIESHQMKSRMEVEALRVQLEEASQSKVAEAERARKSLEDEVQKLKMHLEAAKALEAEKVQQQVQELTLKLENAENSKKREIDSLQMKSRMEVEALRVQLEEASQSKVAEAEKARKNLEGEVQNLKLQLELAKVAQAAESETKAQQLLQQLQQQLEDAEHSKKREIESLQMKSQQELEALRLQLEESMKMQYEYREQTVHLTNHIANMKQGKTVSNALSDQQKESPRHQASNSFTSPPHTSPNTGSVVPTFAGSQPGKQDLPVEIFDPQEYVFFQKKTIEELLKTFRKSKKKVEETTMGNILDPFTAEVDSFQKTIAHDNLKQLQIKNLLKIRKKTYQAYLEELWEITKAKNNRSEVDRIVDDFEDEIFKKGRYPSPTAVHPSSIKQKGVCSDDEEYSDDERTEKQKLKDARTEVQHQNRLQNLKQKYPNPELWRPREDRNRNHFRGGRPSYKRY